MNFRNPFGIDKKPNHSSLAAIQTKINNVFDNFFAPEIGHGIQHVLDSFPAVDVIENANAVVIKAELPQIQAQDIKITANRHFLTISGEKKSQQQQKEDSYHMHELHYGAFARTLELPFEIDDTLTKAEFQHGLLIITVGKPSGMIGTIKNIPVKANA